MAMTPQEKARVGRHYPRWGKAPGGFATAEERDTFDTNAKAARQSTSLRLANFQMGHKRPDLSREIDVGGPPPGPGQQSLF